MTSSPSISVLLFLLWIELVIQHLNTSSFLMTKIFWLLWTFDMKTGFRMQFCHSNTNERQIEKNVNWSEMEMGKIAQTVQFSEISLCAEVQLKGAGYIFDYISTFLIFSAPNFNFLLKWNAVIDLISIAWRKVLPFTVTIFP